MESIPDKTKVKLVVGIIIAAVALIIFAIINPFVMISAGERGIVLRWGAVQDKILGEGISWVWPVMYNVKTLDVKTQKEEVDVNAASKDLQNVTSKIALNYHLDSERVNKLWQNVGKDYKIRIIDPAIQEAVKSVTAKYTAEELVTKRQLVKDEIKVVLSERLTREFILVDELSIVNFDFSSSFNSAIEAKVTAEQNALAAKNKLEQIKFEAQQTVESAKAQAEAIRIQAQAVTSQGGADYVKLQWILAWKEGGAKVPQIITGENSGGFLFNMDSLSK